MQPLTLVHLCKPDDELCEIAAAQLTLNRFTENQDQASNSFLATRIPTKTILP